jgi:arsenate reductase
MAAAYLNCTGAGRFRAESAGSHPAAAVHPLAIETLERHHIPWTGHPPRGMDGLEREPWDVVITVCDRAKESCPFFPGQPVLAHWGMEDPAGAAGSDEAKRRAFDHAFVTLARRIDLLLALPFDKLERRELQGRVRAIGQTTPDAVRVASSASHRP